MNSFQVYLLVACTFPRSNEPSIWVIGSDDFRLKTFPTNHVFYTLPTLPHKYPFSMCTKKLWWLFLHIIQSWRLHIHFHVPNSAVSKSPYFQVKKNPTPEETVHFNRCFMIFPSEPLPKWLNHLHWSPRFPPPARSSVSVSRFHMVSLSHLHRYIEYI